MGMFLNPTMPLAAYESMASSRFFVDKTMLLDEILSALEEDRQQYVCITRPRRFGKTVMANMLGAFLGKAGDSRKIFEKLSIGQSPYYEKHLNRHNVLYIDFSEEPENSTSYDAYFTRIADGIKADLAEAYPHLAIDTDKAVWDILTMIFQKTGDTFVFVMDEWDAVFHMPYISEQDQKAYLRFLKNLLKGKSYVELAYMTGILPIAKYSSGSELNIFSEYNMATKIKYSTYFGFLEDEVDQLYDIYRNTTEEPNITREELRIWYNGYHTASREKLYNPRSVVHALADNQLGSYWTGSGPYDEIFYYIKDNVDDIRDDLLLMISGERIEAKVVEYAATAPELNTKEQIYSAMVVYGLLTYEDGEVFIPNKELMEKYQELLMTNESLGYIYQLARESTRMLRATLVGDTKTMEEILKFAHDTEVPILSYNSETELSAVVNLVYLAARDKYRVEREDKAGEGYVDFIFYPHKKTGDGIIMELKINSSPEEAIAQIRRKHYALRFKGKLGETARYAGRILAVGIGYDKKTKVHQCKVEELS